MERFGIARRLGPCPPPRSPSPVEDLATALRGEIAHACGLQWPPARAVRSSGRPHFDEKWCESVLNVLHHATSEELEAMRTPEMPTPRPPGWKPGMHPFVVPADVLQDTAPIPPGEEPEPPKPPGAEPAAKKKRTYAPP